MPLIPIASCRSLRRGARTAGRWAVRLAGMASLAVAAAPAAHAAGPAVTVYTRDLGFVREQRTIEIQGARDTLRITDVPERIDFSSVALDLDGNARVTRLAYRYDLASGDELIDRARGKEVRITMRGDRTVTGALIAADGAWLTVREPAGGIHTLSRMAVEDVRINDPAAGFSMRPTLEIAIEGARRGRADARLSYLTGGMSWSAEHTVVRRGEREATWSAGVTIENHSGRDYADAALKLVAGEPNRVGGMPPPVPLRTAMMLEAKDAGGAADLSEQAFAEYHLYTLDRPATLRNRESQKLSMIEPRTVQVTPRYVYRGGDPRGVRTQLEVANTRAAGIGVPLPGGRVRFYEIDAAGDLQFTGEARLNHTAEGETLRLDVGSAFDLVAERRDLYNRRISDREREYAVEVELRNRKPNDVTIVAQETVGGDIEIIEKSHAFVRRDANTIEFTVRVPAGGEVRVRYTARVRY